MEGALVYLHPVPGLVAAVLFYWVATAGFRARHPEPYAPGARLTHRRLSWIAVGLVLLGVGSGAAATALLRDDLTLGSSRHFLAGCVLVALVGLQALTSRNLSRHTWARRVHMGGGLATLVGIVAVAALGMSLLP